MSHVVHMTKLLGLTCIFPTTDAHFRKQFLCFKTVEVHVTRHSSVRLLQGLLEQLHLSGKRRRNAISSLWLLLFEEHGAATTMTKKPPDDCTNSFSSNEHLGRSFVTLVDFYDDGRLGLYSSVV